MCRELYAVERPFSRGENSQIDCVAIQEIIRAEIYASMSEQTLRVRDIVANLLLTDPSMIYHRLPLFSAWQTLTFYSQTSWCEHVCRRHLYKQHYQ